MREGGNEGEREGGREGMRERGKEGGREAVVSSPGQTKTRQATSQPTKTYNHYALKRGDKMIGLAWVAGWMAVKQREGKQTMV